MDNEQKIGKFVNLVNSADSLKINGSIPTRTWDLGIAVETEKFAFFSARYRTKKMKSREASKVVHISKEGVDEGFFHNGVFFCRDKKDNPVSIQFYKLNDMLAHEKRF